MQTRAPCPSEEFSPATALALLLPLLILASTIAGPWLWDRVNELSGTNLPNLPSILVRYMLNGTGTFLVVANFIVAGVCCPKGLVHCHQTQGHERVRFAFMLFHLVGIAVLMIGSPLIIELSLGMLD